MTQCYDCQRPYGTEHGFPDLVIESWAWRSISPTGDDGGLLCPSCICQRLAAQGITAIGAFTSGPIRSVDEATMWNRRVIEELLERETVKGQRPPSAEDAA
ncbi:MULTISPECIES: hypothetical protein [Hyphobacterium]|uniref:Uncharacterized protein n=1 Tax=Hyphobacterium vulgare TaxID=1736751 RepID=A0ABV6ZUC1_9PROT